MLETLAPNTSAKVGRDFPGCGPLRAQRQHDLVNGGQPTLRFFTITGSNVEPVSRGTSISTGRTSVSTVRAGTVAGARSRARTRRDFRTEVFVHFHFQCGLEDVHRDPVQQPVRADEVDALRSGLRQELLRYLLLIQFSRNGVHGVAQD